MKKSEKYNTMTRLHAKWIDKTYNGETVRPSLTFDIARNIDLNTVADFKLAIQEVMNRIPADMPLRMWITNNVEDDTRES